jgi:hypothetical protein
MIFKNFISSRRIVFPVITIFFVFWAVIFVYNTSFIAIDGKRYFCLFDDAMISLRYAWNLSHGNGLVWNPGEFVEGYTNLLMTLLMSISTFLFSKPLAALSIQILGIFLMLGIAFLSVRIIKFFIPKNLTPSIRLMLEILVFFCSLFYYPLTFWTLNGMETGLLSLLLLLSIYNSFLYLQNHNFYLLIYISVFLGMAFLTRADSILFAFVIFLHIFLSESKFGINNKFFIRLLSCLALYLIFITAQIVFRTYYYGEFYPNTYYLKLTGIPFWFRIKQGIIFLIPFFNEIKFLLLVVVISLITSYTKEKLFLFSNFFITIIYQIIIGGDAWNYWRLSSPTIPLLFILFILAVFSFLNKIFLREKLNIYVKYLLISLLIIISVGNLIIVDERFLDEISFSRILYKEENKINVNTAIILNDILKTNATIGVFWAGAIPYYTDNKSIDYLGKCDKIVSRVLPESSKSDSRLNIPGHNKSNLDYSIKTLKPTYSQGFHWEKQDLISWADSVYVKTFINGIRLDFLKNSPDVKWENINVRY